jgi:hypothetical protein
MKAKNNKQIASYDISDGVFKVQEIISGHTSNSAEPNLLNPTAEIFSLSFLLKQDASGTALIFEIIPAPSEIFFLWRPMKYILQNQRMISVASASIANQNCLNRMKQFYRSFTISIT